MRARIILVKGDLFSVVGFPDFLKDKQIVVYHPELTVLHCNIGTIASCSVFQKTGDH